MGSHAITVITMQFFALALAFLGLASAFHVAPLAARRAPITAVMGIEESATAKNKEVFTLINKLEKLNKATSRSKKTMAEIEKIIGAASRSFSVVEGFDFPGEPIGYTGKVGTTTTAGKVM